MMYEDYLARWTEKYLDEETSNFIEVLVDSAFAIQKTPISPDNPFWKKEEFWDFFNFGLALGLRKLIARVADKSIGSFSSDLRNFMTDELAGIILLMVFADGRDDEIINWNIVAEHVFKHYNVAEKLNLAAQKRLRERMK